VRKSLGIAFIRREDMKDIAGSVALSGLSQIRQALLHGGTFLQNS
jgi:hypothetical protein